MIRNWANDPQLGKLAAYFKHSTVRMLQIGVHYLGGMTVLYNKNRNLIYSEQLFGIRLEVKGIRNWTINCSQYCEREEESAYPAGLKELRIVLYLAFHQI